MADDRLIVIGELRVDSDPVKKVDKEVDKLTNSIKGTEKATTKLNRTAKKNMKEMDKATKKVSKTTEGLKGNLKDLATGFVAAAGIKQAINTFAAFEDEMLRVKALTGATAEEYKVLYEESKRLGSTTAFTASQVARAQGNLAQSGFKTNEIMAATNDVLSLASASQIDLARSSEILSKNIRIFGLEASEAGRVSDVLAKAQASSSANVEFLASAMNNAGAGARNMGYDLENVVALTSAIAPAFAEGSSAGTALNATFRDMAKNRGELEKLGVSVVDNEGNFRDLTAIMKDYSRATENMTAIQKKDTQAKIFGEESQKAVNVLLGEGATAAIEYEKAFRDAAGTSQVAATMMESGMGGVLRSLSSSLEGLTITLLETFAPAIIGTVNLFTSLIGVANTLFSVINRSDVLQSLTAGLLGATIAVKTLAFAFNILNISNPFGWIALGITGITLLEKKFGLLSKAAGGIKKVFGIGATETVDNGGPVQKLASGTTNAKGGMTLVGEQGPELVNMPQGASVYNNTKTMKSIGGSSVSVGGDSISINISGAGDPQSMWEQIKPQLEQHERRKRDRLVAVLR